LFSRIIITPSIYGLIMTVFARMRPLSQFVRNRRNCIMLVACFRDQLYYLLLLPF